MKRYSYNEEMLTIKEIAERTNIQSSKIRYRIKVGLPITGPVRTLYEFNGKNMTLKEWAIHLNINQSTLSTRLKCKLPYEKVFCGEKILNTNRAKSGIYYDPVSGLSGTRAEMAQIFEVSPQAIHLWAKEGKLERKISDKHIGETKSGWLIINADESGLDCICEICEKAKHFDSINCIKKCKNPDHKIINTRKRLMGKTVLTMKVVEIIEIKNQRNIRVIVECKKCEGIFEIWETNMYKGCRCQK